VFADAPIAIIDIGSNSVRLVVYSGARRAPSVIFNEKVMAGLGREVGRSGRLDEEAQERALKALARFQLLTREMGVVLIRVVATAAVRDASNGESFLRRVRALGLRPTILAGEEEARLAGLGVISGILDADGVVGDLGGGSLELVEVRDRKLGRSVSLPFGVLRLDALAANGEDAFARTVRDGVEGAGFAGAAKGRAFYLVGGSWRTLARVEMALTGHPLPITHQHSLPPQTAAKLPARLRKVDQAELRAIPSVTSSRIATLPRAAQLLACLVDLTRPAELVASTFGIREGLLYDELDAKVRSRDPLVEAAREAGAGLGRFAQHGELLDGWIAPLFDDPPRFARLRLAACLLADIAWAAHPDFRAERGIDMALHGNWVAIDARGRVMLAQALHSTFGGSGPLPYADVAALCSAEELKLASLWGSAIRLGQRLSGGVAAGLERSRLELDDGVLRLTVRRSHSALLGEPVERRLKALANGLGVRGEAAIA
jgi:exopolyphosphatase/guanosine-5'-triphosphate,3'-diphosphate pyrophosphatase